jgi:hypothetical protein
MKTYAVCIVALAAMTSSLVACSKASDDPTFQLASVTLGKAKEHIAKGDAEAAKGSCQTIDKSGLRKLKGEEVDALFKEIDDVCVTDWVAVDNKKEILDAAKTIQTKGASASDFDRSQLKSKCDFAKSMAKGGPRPAEKDLTDTIAKVCKS